MNLIFTKIIAVLTSLVTMLTAVFLPSEKVIPEFLETSEQVKTVFDEGEFVMGENDLIVAPYGDDSNEGSLEAPLKTFERAKELLKNNGSDEAITVWFREGSYLIEDTVKFNSADKSNVLYRSYSPS